MIARSPFFSPTLFASILVLSSSACGSSSSEGVAPVGLGGSGGSGGSVMGTGGVSVGAGGTNTAVGGMPAAGAAGMAAAGSAGMPAAGAAGMAAAGAAGMAAAGAGGMAAAGAAGMAAAGAAGMGTSGAAGAGTSGAAGASAFVAAPHLDPTPIPKQPGSVLHDAKVVSITWAGDPDTQGYLDVLDALAASDWAKAVDADYGTGTITHLTNVVISAPPPASTSVSKTIAFIDQSVADGTLPKSPDAQPYLYFVMYPKQTQISFVGGGNCDYVAWHQDTQQGNVFAIYPEACTSVPIGDGKTSRREMNISHELVESLTDPFVLTKPAWFFGMNVIDTFGTVDGGEVADLCFDEAALEGTHTFSRFWSNSQIAAHRNGCAPYAAGQVGFNVSPPNKNILHGKPGTTITVPLTGWSEADIGSWTLKPQWYYGDFDPKPSVDVTTLTNGGSATLTLTIPATAKASMQSHVILYSFLTTSDYHIWPFQMMVD